MGGHELLGGGDGLLHAESVEREAVEGIDSLTRTVHDGAFLGVKALFAHVGAFDEGHDGQAEVAGKGIVARVVGGHGHDRARAVAGEHVVGNPHGDGVAREGIDGVGAAEHARHPAVGDAFALGALLRGFEVGFDLGALSGRGELLHEFALGGEHHEGNAEDGVGAGGEDGELHVAVLHGKFHLRAFRAANPVALRFLDGVRPVDGVESVEEALRVGRHAEAPLLHLLLHHGVSAAFAHAVDHLVVGQHGAEGRAPVHHRLAQVGDAVVHEHLELFLLRHGLPLRCREPEFLALGHVEALGALLLEVGHEAADGLCRAAGVAVEGVEHAAEGPLRPVVILGVAGAHLALPVEAEAYLVELLAVAGDVLLRGDGRVLSGLDGILFGGESVGIVAHGVEHVVALRALVARIDVRGDVAQGVAHMESGAGGVGEHVEHVELLLVGVSLYVVCLFRGPFLLPLLFDFSEVVFHFCFWFCAAKLVQGVDNRKERGVFS